MKGDKPTIKWKIDTTIVAFKIAVVDLVVEVPQMQSLLVAKQDPFEPRMSRDGQQPIECQMKDDVNGMGCDGKVNEH